MQFQLIGCGKMWEVILKWLLDFSVSPQDISIQETNEQQCTYLKDVYKICLWTNSNTDIIILAVKPQQIGEIDFLKFSKSALLFSIMAWVSIKKLETLSWIKNIIRSIPNFPLSVGRGVLGYVEYGNIDQGKKNLILNVFSQIGKVIKLKNEDQIDQITALSWSGPAYFYYLTELVKNQAKNFWFSEEDATVIAQETFVGSALLLDQSVQSASQLKANVTSKGWTTEAAIQTMKDEWIEEIIKNWINAAYTRAQSLNK